MASLIGFALTRVVVKPSYRVLIPPKRAESPNGQPGTFDVIDAGGEGGIRTLGAL
jgi:hypothetical protein